MPLRGDHDVGLVQHEDLDLLEVEEAELEAPVQDLEKEEKSVGSISERRRFPPPVFRTPPPSRGQGGGDPSRAPKAQTKRGRRWTNEGGRAKGAKHIVTSAIHRIIISKGGIGREFHKAQREKQEFLNN